MGLREDFLRRIEKKKAEIEAMRVKMEAEIAAEKRYLDAMLDAYKLLPRSGESSNGSAPSAFRKGSNVAKAYDALKRSGRPMHVAELVEAMGQKVNRTTTQGLASSLRAYEKKGEIFTKPAPNTYGLVEFGTEAATTSNGLLDGMES